MPGIEAGNAELDIVAKTRKSHTFLDQVPHLPLGAIVHPRGRLAIAAADLAHLGGRFVLVFAGVGDVVHPEPALDDVFVGPHEAVRHVGEHALLGAGRKMAAGEGAGWGEGG